MFVALSARSEQVLFLLSFPIPTHCQVYSSRLFYIAVVGIMLMVIAREIEYIYGDAMKWAVIGVRCINSLVRGRFTHIF